MQHVGDWCCCKHSSGSGWFRVLQLCLTPAQMQYAFTQMYTCKPLTQSVVCEDLCRNHTLQLPSVLLSLLASFSSLLCFYSLQLYCLGSFLLSSVGMDQSATCASWVQHWKTVVNCMNLRNNPNAIKSAKSDGWWTLWINWIYSTCFFYRLRTLLLNIILLPPSTCWIYRKVLTPTALHTAIPQKHLLGLAANSWHKLRCSLIWEKFFGTLTLLYLILPKTLKQETRPFLFYHRCNCWIMMHTCHNTP